MCMYCFHELTVHIALTIVIQPCFLAGEARVTIFSCYGTVCLWLGDEVKSKAGPGWSACLAFKVKNWLYSHVEWFGMRQYWQHSNAILAAHHVLHTDLSALVLGTACLAKARSETGLQRIDRKPDLIWKGPRFCVPREKSRVVKMQFYGPCYEQLWLHLQWSYLSQFRSSGTKCLPQAL